MISPTAASIAKRLQSRRVKAAIAIQRRFRKWRIDVQKRVAFVEKLCGENGVFKQMKLLKLFDSWATWAAGQAIRWEQGVPYMATRAGYLWIDGDRKEFGRKLLVYHEKVEVVHSETDEVLIAFPFNILRTVLRGEGHHKNEVTIVRKDAKRETFFVVNATAFMDAFEFNFKKWYLALQRKAHSEGRKPLNVFVKTVIEQKKHRPAIEPHLPDVEERKSAVGDTSNLPAPLQSALDGESDRIGFFAPAQAPWRDDWAQRYEKLMTGQSYKEWVESKPTIPCGNNQSKIYLVAIGDLDEDNGGCELRKVADLLRAYFFGMQVHMLPPMPLCGLHKDRGMRIPIQFSGINPEKAVGKRNKQLVFDTAVPIKVKEAEKYLKKLVPNDAFILIGVTLHEVIGGKDFGQGNYLMHVPPSCERAVKTRTAVLSLARIDPWFQQHPHETFVHETRDERKITFLRRCALWFVHHMMLFLGMHNCVYHSCAMNGFATLDEMKCVPIQACPVCLRKLMDAVGIKTTVRCLERYQALRVYFRVHRGFENEVRWYSARSKMLDEAHEKHVTEETLERMFGRREKVRLDPLIRLPALSNKLSNNKPSNGIIEKLQFTATSVR